MSVCRRCGRLHRWQWHPRGVLGGVGSDRAWQEPDECDDDDDGIPPVDCSQLCDYVDRGDFHVGHDDAGLGAATLVCKVCGGDRWQVGSVQGYYHTLAKCCGCGYETTVHNG